MAYEFLSTLLLFFKTLAQADVLTVLLLFFPFALLFEFPLTVLVWIGMIRYALRQQHQPAPQRSQYPTVSCLLLCYAEGDGVRASIISLAHQEYPGFIELLVIVDGAIQNAATLRAAQVAAAEVQGIPRRKVRIVPKWQRGGRVSSLNLGLELCSGEICMALDGDTSFDNDMVDQTTKHFTDPNVIAVSGNLRVRNAKHSLATRLQALEYMLSISGGKTGLSEFNIINNVSGAFGVFRKSFLMLVSGWDSGTAEDLDLTLRLKQYFGRHHHLRIVFEPLAVGHTDVPDSLVGFFKQRWRWDGDLVYVFWNKYRYNIRPRLLGWPNFLFTLYTGLIQQLILPFAIAIYTFAMFWLYPTGFVLAIAIFVFIVYFIILLAQFFLYLTFISERPREDFKYAIYLPIFPLFTFAARINSGFALLQNVFLKSHLDSSMAPWWVLRKTKF